MADIIGFPKDELTKGDRKRLEKFLQEEFEDIQDTSCKSYKEMQNNMAQYFKQQGFEVDSIQLEISKQLRGMLIVDFVEALNSALQVALQAAVEPKATLKNLPKGKVSVEEAANQVIEICTGHLYEAALEVADWLSNAGLGVAL